MIIPIPVCRVIKLKEETEMSPTILTCLKWPMRWEHNYFPVMKGLAKKINGPRHLMLVNDFSQEGKSRDRRTEGQSSTSKSRIGVHLVIVGD